MRRLFSLLILGSTVGTIQAAPIAYDCKIILGAGNGNPIDRVNQVILDTDAEFLDMLSSDAAGENSWHFQNEGAPGTRMVMSTFGSTTSGAGLREDAAFSFELKNGSLTMASVKDGIATLQKWKCK